MILVLNGADFSANNIGTIDIPVEMHEFTKNMFSKLTRFSIDSEQATAINKFIVMLEEQDILSHIAFFGSSYLANSLDECCYDVVTNTQYTASNGLIYDGDAGGVAIDSSIVDNIILGYSISSASIPTINFFGIIPISADNKYSYHSANSFNMGLKCTQTYSEFLPINTGNYNKNNGYTISGDKSKPFILWNLKGLQDFDTNGSTLNYNNTFVISGTYSKSLEPMSDYVQSFIVARSGNHYFRTLYFAGDGYSLSDSQLSALYTGLETLMNSLMSIEGLI